MTSRFVAVHVEDHEHLPEGCSMRFRATGEARPVERVRYEAEDGTSGQWTVVGVEEGGGLVAATTMPVDDSGAGTSYLVMGGTWGLRLTLEEPSERGVHAEAREEWVPYLLLSRGALGDE